MRYISTRGGMAPQSFSDILLGGLAPDGGLVVPEQYPQIDEATLARWRALSYPELAFEIVSLFATDISAADLKAIVDKTYTKEIFGSDDITPLKTLEPGLHILELSNGPTLAFKDVAMQLLGNLFEYVLEKRGEQINIVGATSGDTGSAAEYAMRGKHRVNVFMLSPHGKMSPFQRAQMYSLQDANIYNIAVKGMFDDAQDMVKAVNNDAAFKARYKIGAVNSINWGRIVAQVVYYFKAYFAVSEKNGDAVSFVVPSGNFGNVCAGHIARQMGLPIKQLIVATNENDVLDEFFRTGVYKVRGEAQATSSPSMDISKASNLERFVFDLVGRDSGRLAELWHQVDQAGGFDLSGAQCFGDVGGKYGFASGRSSHADRLTTIRQAKAAYGVTIDPHTADGMKVALEVRDDSAPVVVLETALPAKFEDTIVEALGEKPVRPAFADELERLPQRVEEMDADVTQLKRFIADHIA
ncbi:threonine synthase [Chitinivorax sp. PXF-14]|uniref:threonine synthase n=1 Tax=Chitinivorax sp. PXF-14 TaxID=3230488 RepID=UPI003467DA28